MLLRVDQHEALSLGERVRAAKEPRLADSAAAVVAAAESLVRDR